MAWHPFRNLGWKALAVVLGTALLALAFGIVARLVQHGKRDRRRRGAVAEGQRTVAEVLDHTGNGHVYLT